MLNNEQASGEKIPCSVPVLTLNSGKFLRRCLNSLVDFADVFLVDGNSTDDTLKIAAEYNIPVYKQVETNAANVPVADFSAIRIRSVGLAKFDWVLLVDSDEFLDDNLADEIRQHLKSESAMKIVYNIQKKYCIGDKKVEYAFNYPNYYPRLHNRKSGAGFKSGKVVHEQMFIPPDVRVVDLENCVYSELLPTYKDCVEKDNFQLGLMKQSTFAPGAYKNRRHSLKISLLYFLRAGNILRKSVIVYMRHGYQKSLPIGLVMRHVRVHLFMSYWRLLQCVFGNTLTV